MEITMIITSIIVALIIIEAPYFKYVQDIKSDLKDLNKELAAVKNELLIQKNKSIQDMPKQSPQLNISANNDISQDVMSVLQANLPPDRELIFAKPIKLKPGQNNINLDIHDDN